MIDFDELRAVTDILLRITPPPTRAETIHEAWRMVGARFPYDDGTLIVEHDLGIVPAIRFELVDYAAVTVVEAEGVIVARMPKLG